MGKLVAIASTVALTLILSNVPTFPQNQPIVSSGKIWLWDSLASRRFKWNPQPDITTYELAQCVPLFVLSSNADAGQIFDSLPPSVQRHWQEIK